MNLWYLGPLGDLRALSCPESGISINEVRYGGVHQSISGARSLDVTGFRSDYRFDWKWISQDEWVWLDALHTRHVPGPFRLINPLKKNRLTPQSTSGRMSGVSNSGVWPFINAAVPDRDYPPAVPIPGRSISMSGWGSSFKVEWDRAKQTVIFPQEMVTGSIYMRGLANHSASLYFDFYDPDGGLASTQTQAAAITTTWQRFSITRAAPAGAASVVLRLGLLTANTTVRFACPQVESGPAATVWETGGGAPAVLIDQLTSTTPRFPFRDCSMTLLEQ